MREFNLTSKQIKELKRVHRNLPQKRDADKIKAIIMLGTGWSIEQTAELLLLNASTLYRYVEKYEDGGVEELLRTDYQGSQPKLSEEQLEELDAHLSENIYINAKDIVEYIRRTFGVCYTINGVTSLLKRLGYVYKKPKKVPGKADKEAQEEFLKTYENIKLTKGLHDAIYFADGTHPQYNSVAAYGWIKRGEHKIIKSNTGRKHLNINGAVNIESYETVVRFEDSINAESTVELLKKIESKHPKAEHIFVICDNARYYRSRLVREYLEDSKIILVFLPTYAPNLNLIERLWKYFRKMILYNKYYDTFDIFKTTCERFFDNIKKHRDSLSRLLSENFEIITC